MIPGLIALLALAQVPAAVLRATGPGSVVCLGDAAVPITLENVSSQVVLATLSVEGRVVSPDGGSSSEVWRLVQEDLLRTTSLAPSKVLVAVELKPGARRTVSWDLVGRSGPPALSPGLYRVVASVGVPGSPDRLRSEILRLELAECAR